MNMPKQDTASEQYKISSIIELARDLYTNPHPLFGFDHGYSVMKNAEKITSMLDEPVDMMVVRTGALLHDVAFDSQDHLKTHAIESAGRITPALTYEGSLDRDQILRVTTATQRHSTHSWHLLGKPHSIEEKIVFDADQIEWLNAKGIVKVHIIYESLGKSWQEFYEEMPKILESRYQRIFLPETKKIIKNDYQVLMECVKGGRR